MIANGKTLQNLDSSTDNFSKFRFLPMTDSIKIETLQMVPRARLFKKSF